MSSVQVWQTTQHWQLTRETERTDCQQKHVVLVFLTHASAMTSRNYITNHFTYKRHWSKNSTNKANSIAEPADLFGAGPSWLWTYQVKVRRACCHFPAPCWGGGLVSAWCIYCSAMDTSEAPDAYTQKTNLICTSLITNMFLLVCW